MDNARKALGLATAIYCTYLIIDQQVDNRLSEWIQAHWYELREHYRMYSYIEYNKPFVVFEAMTVLDKANENDKQ